jgi:hypothetical protein
MVIALIVIAVLVVVGFFTFKHRKSVEATLEKDAATLKVSAEAEVKKVEAKL